jgi:hypothetical protein
MNIKSNAYALSALLFFGFLNPAHALSTLLTDFVEANSERVEALAPSLTATYPHAKFFVSGFTFPLGEWAFIRVEDANACDNDLCPTVVVVEKTEWKVLVVAKKQIEVSTSFDNGGTVRCKLFSKGGSEILLRYVNGAKTLYIAQ